jgi:hypothetical protein
MPVPDAKTLAVSEKGYAGHVGRETNYLEV